MRCPASVNPFSKTGSTRDTDYRDLLTFRDGEYRLGGVRRRHVTVAGMRLGLRDGMFFRVCGA